MASKQCTPHILVNIKYQEYSRPLLCPQSCILADILEDFMKLFADYIPQERQPSDFRFQLVKGKDILVALTNDYKLKNNDLLVARSVDERQSPVISHKIEADESYYMWSMCSQTNDGLMKLDGTTIKCDGISDDSANLIKFTANDVSSSFRKRYAFTLPSDTDPSKVYAIKGQGEDQPLIVEELDKSAIIPSIGDEFKFKCVQFFSFMQYRCENVEGRIDLYISALKDGTVQLQKAGVKGYPRPSTLFIAANMI